MAGEVEKCIEMAFRLPSLDDNVRADGKNTVKSLWKNQLGQPGRRCV